MTLLLQVRALDVYRDMDETLLPSEINILNNTETKPVEIFESLQNLITNHFLETLF